MPTTPSSSPGLVQVLQPVQPVLSSLRVRLAPPESPDSDRLFLWAGNRGPKARYSFLGKWQMTEDTGTPVKASGDTGWAPIGRNHPCVPPGGTGTISSLFPVTESCSFPSLSFPCVKRFYPHLDKLGKNDADEEISSDASSPLGRHWGAQLGTGEHTLGKRALENHF